MDKASGLHALFTAFGVTTTPVNATAVRASDGTVMTVKSSARAVTPSVIDADLSRHDHVFYTVKRATPALRQRALTDRNVGYAALTTQEVVYGGQLAHLDENTKTETPAKSGPKPFGRYAVARVLLRTSHPLTQRELAAAVGISQPAVSQSLASLNDHGQVTRSQGGWTAADPEALFDYTVSSYPGSGGIRVHYFSRRPVIEQGEQLRTACPSGLLTGDAAAAQFAPWRLSRTATVYAPTGPAERPTGMVDSSERDRTATIVVPADPTITLTARHWWGDAATTTDPIITAWEVRQSGGAGDQEEAIAVIREQVLTDRQQR